MQQLRGTNNIYLAYIFQELKFFVTYTKHDTNI
jgi:hypothetical protein